MSNVDDALSEIGEEWEYATQKFDPFTSYHEGYAVIKEELDELWDEIKGGQKPNEIRKEAEQIAATALRFMLEIDEMSGDAEAMPDELIES